LDEVRGGGWTEREMGTEKQKTVSYETKASLKGSRQSRPRCLTKLKGGKGGKRGLKSGEGRRGAT